MRIKKHVPFGYKLMLSYSVIIVLPSLIIGYLANTIYADSMRTQTRDNMNITLQQIRDNVQYKLDDIERLTELLYTDTEMIDRIRHYERGWVSYENTTKYVIPRLYSIIDSTSQIIWLSVYLHNKTLPEIYNYSSDPELLREGRFDLYHITRIENKDWYVEFPQEVYGRTKVWRQIEDDTKFGRISLLRRIMDIKKPLSMAELGLIRISVPVEDIFESVDFNKFGDGTALYIADREGGIILASGRTDEELETLAHEQSNPSFLAIEEPIPELGWKIAAHIPVDIVDRDIRKVMGLTYLISTLSVLALFAVGALLTRYFSLKVRKIISVLDSFQQGEFHKRIHFKDNDEFTRISLALNDMGQNIGELIRKVYIADLEKKEAELETLQAQINPHFLYNTLSSINRLAKFGETAKLQKMVRDLAAFYRLSLSDGRSIIPIGSELAQTNAYVDIQRIKYEDRMTIQFEIDPELFRYSTLKLILQPFVENIVEHAWCGDRIYVRIVGYKSGQDVVFHVIDDGIGMPRELSSRLSDPSETRIGYGIRNVDQRIKLHYGAAYGVRVYSRLGIGTNVTITFPAERRE
ncbi:sensor histidine kinase [Paenibacillaceae bacterium WGS1546]|uniref:sensor histidine kinase n=1 Tax=Cohnella sp. WGS1546 TaxID=3366810 RepID=UPI00372CF943